MTPESDTPDEEDNGAIEIATSGKQPKAPKAKLPTIDWISRWIVTIWLAIAGSASIGLLLSIFVLKEVPNMTVIKEVIQLLGAPAGMILTYYFLESKNGKGGDGED